ncbi:hypothetical protein DB771_18485 [Burkholderia sp. AU29985]|nr:hypothetical protein XM57_03145 [Burkholderia cepacia]AYZ95540.1 hypothetical protein EGY28_09990 [Burkholderia dolosa]ETP61855.1 hypothetical protein BDSB_29350 [Burkholderia dolosa PC543]PRE50996.1 hypothetical protein C6P87_10905 [Burkholderia sp. AU12872]PUA75483.1 hypothetical protein DB771_18485 [Burkholderia sp. AU29985]
MRRNRADGAQLCSFDAGDALCTGACTPRAADRDRFGATKARAALDAREATRADVAAREHGCAVGAATSLIV